ncbi:MAG: hypothetical protein ACK5Y6_04505 [Pseudomonadota bacterium]
MRELFDELEMLSRRELTGLVIGFVSGTIFFVALFASGCGGGSRGTGSFGLDGTRPPALSNDASNVLRGIPADSLVEATPTPKR